MKKGLILLLTATLLACSGCGNKQEGLITGFEENPETKIEQTQTVGDITVTLHHVAFEEQRMIIDYTVKADNIEDYTDCLLDVSVAGQSETRGSGSVTIYYEKTGNEYHMISVEDMGENRLSKDNVGENVKISMFFQTAYLKELLKDTVCFDVKLDKIFETKQITLNEELTYEHGSMIVDEVEVSPFYTRLSCNYTENIMWEDEMYMGAVIGENGEEVDCLGGLGNSYFYCVLPQDCKKIEIAVLRHKTGEDSKLITESVEVNLQ